MAHAVQGLALSTDGDLEVALRLRLLKCTNPLHTVDFRGVARRRDRPHLR